MATIYKGRTSKTRRVEKCEMPRDSTYLDIVLAHTALTEACEHHGVDSGAVHNWLTNNPDHPVADFVHKLIKSHVPGASFKVKTKHLTRTQKRDLDLYEYVQESIELGEADDDTEALSQIRNSTPLSHVLKVVMTPGAVRKAYLRGEKLA